MISKFVLLSKVEVLVCTFARRNLALPLSEGYCAICSLRDLHAHEPCLLMVLQISETP